MYLEIIPIFKRGKVFSKCNLRKMHISGVYYLLVLQHMASYSCDHVDCFGQSQSVLQPHQQDLSKWHHLPGDLDPFQRHPPPKGTWEKLTLPRGVLQALYSTHLNGPEQEEKEYTPQKKPSTIVTATSGLRLHWEQSIWVLPFTVALECTSAAVWPQPICISMLPCLLK